ncbi:sugar transferase [Novosphingobium aquiterrae]|uniref:Sugar transferase n=1 Tax=Novosphingobium aquiterrae TaxID=624388 RepID=A0ABV6PGH8_9SPHN
MTAGAPGGMQAVVTRGYLDPADEGGPRFRSLVQRRLQCYLALICGDLAALYVGFVAAGYLYLGAVGITQASLLSQLVMPVFLTIALYNGAYSMRALESAQHGGLRAALALLISAAAVVFIAFYTKSSHEFSRILFSLGIVLSLLALLWVRTQMRDFVRWRCGPRVLSELLIVDGGPDVQLGGAWQVDAQALGLRPALDDPHALHRIGLLLQAADRVVVSCAAERRSAWTTILRGANVSGEVLEDSVAELGAHGARIAGGHGWLRISVGPLGLRARATKRLFDIIVAGTGLIVLSPLLLLVAIAILVEDGSPVLFIQRRVGRGNRFFDIVKFRSMANVANDGHGAQSASRNDARITRVGRLIRRTSIDELPQLFNVLIGQMSMVGPRPHALGSQAGDKLFWEVDGRYWQRHALKPGLTGLAQIRGLRGATEAEEDLQERLDADLEYVDGWSLWRDIAIIAGTVTVVIHERAF